MTTRVRLIVNHIPTNNADAWMTRRLSQDWDKALPPEGAKAIGAVIEALIVAAANLPKPDTEKMLQRGERVYAPQVRAIVMGVDITCEAVYAPETST